MACKLCNNEVPLRNSHIIPEFLYASLYDDKHRFYEISVDTTKKIHINKKALENNFFVKTVNSLFQSMKDTLVWPLMVGLQ